jgi:hypothetical protein
MAFPATLDYLNNMSRIGALSPKPINDLLRVEIGFAFCG